MSSRINQLVKLAFDVSRFRFWLYLGGTYMAGYIIGATSLQQFLDISFLIQLLYFIIPANIFLYGINDLADQDTDAFNTKKDEKEVRIEAGQQEKDLKLILSVITIISIGVLFLQPDLVAAGIFIAFYFLSFAYSYPPFRFKAQPYWDFSSNILYALPGILAYYQVSGYLPPFLIWFALYLWTGAMHLFSAVPDIEADKKAGVKTTAVELGGKTSLVVCAAFWATFISIAVIVYQAYTPWSYIGFLYPLIPAYILLKPESNIDRIYWWYPYINSLFGFFLSVLAGWDLLVELFTEILF